MPSQKPPAGKCQRCGKKSAPGKTLCRPHLDDQARRQRKYWRSKGKSRRPTAERCGELAAALVHMTGELSFERAKTAPPS